MERRSVETIVRALEQARVRYPIAGGLAVVARGHLRFTADLHQDLPRARGPGVNGGDEHAWESGWEGHERAQRERLARLPLALKLEWLEETQRLVERLRAARRARGGDAA